MAGVKAFVKRMLGIEHLHSRIDRTESELSSLVENESRRILSLIQDDHVKGLNWRIDQIAKELTVRMDAGDHTLTERADKADRAITERMGMDSQAILHTLRTEYTVMPRFLFHQPLDYYHSTYPPKFAPIETVPGEPFPVPGPADRMGYCPNDTPKYLHWGKHDHNFLLGLMDRNGVPRQGATVLDFGCSSGRVLRHFETEHRERGWKPMGVDVQALPVEWIRRHLPKHYEVAVCSVFPHLPFEDNTLDAIYGISVFTHIKYLWDMWIQELRRVLKPGGLLLMSIHAEPAWEHYHKNRELGYIKENLPSDMLARPKMEEDFFYYGDQGVSQVFWKKEIAREFWGRYLTVIDVLPPEPGESFQSWMVCRK